jgi:hypothetical protein
MPALQDPKDSSEDEYSTIPGIDQAASSSPLDDHSKPHDQFNSDPLLPTPAATISPDPDPDPDPQFPTQASSATIERSPTPEFQPSAQTSRKKRKRRSSHDLNAAQNRKLIDGNLRDTHILPKGLTRSQKPSCKSSSFFVNKY